MKFITAGVIISLSITVGARGDVVLDQQHSFTSSLASSTNGDESQMGQTFTVGVAGTLDHIEVLMFRIGSIFDPTGDPLLRVFNTADGLPTGEPLATVTIPEANVPLNNAAFVSFGLSSAAIGVNIGEVLAFSVTATSGIGPYFLLTDQGQSIEYAGGAAIAMYGANPWQQISPPQDHGFKTYVLADVVEEHFGDYNDDGFVDAADYTVWRNNFGDATDADILFRGDGLDGVDDGDYDIWKQYYGDEYEMGSGGGIDSQFAVPEPSTLMLGFLAMGPIAALRRRQIV